MNKPNPAPEPTMEEILASIRRIISDGDDGSSSADADAGTANGASAAANKAAEPDADIFDLTEDMVEEEVEIAELTKTKAAEPEAMDPDDIDKLMASEEMDADEIDKLMAAEPVEDASDVDEDEERAGPEPDDVAFDEPDAEPEEEPEPEPVAAKRAEARADVQPGLLSPQSDAAVASAFGRLANTILSRDARTLEDLVGDMLRPMLKEWLDDNLPVLVEKLVREEIERVSRGGR